MSLDAKEWIYWECNECSIMFPHLTVPKKCHCGNNLESNSTKKRLVLTFHIKVFKCCIHIMMPNFIYNHNMESTLGFIN